MTEADWYGRGLRLAETTGPDAAAIAGWPGEPIFEVWRGEALLGHVYEQAPWGWWGVTNTRPVQHVSQPPTREQAVEDLARKMSPRVACLCGSTRFLEAFQAANLAETLAGRVVLSIGCDTKQDHMLGLDAAAKERLDELHRRKIDMADEVLVLNVGGYIGDSTRREIAYARSRGKAVSWLEPVEDSDGATADASFVVLDDERPAPK